jgi:hypothetical protein
MHNLIPAHLLRRPEGAGARENAYYRAFAPRPLRLTPVMPLAALVGVVAFLVELASR